MTVRSQRVFLRAGNAVPAASIETIYTAPEGRTAIVKHLVLTNTTGVLQDFVLRTTSPGMPGTPRTATFRQVPVFDDAQLLGCYVVLPAGGTVSLEQASWVAGQTSATVLAFGVLLSGVPA